MADDSLNLRALKVGDDAAWAEAFRLLWPVVWHAARHPEARLTIEDAEEAAMDALSQLVQQIDEVQTIEQLKALACMMAYRRAISRARRNSAIKRGPAPLSLEGMDDFHLPVEPSFGTGTPATALELSERVILLRRALNGLDPESRMLLEQKIGSGVSYQELGLQHSMPIGTVCAKVSRGLRKLRRIMEKSPALMKELKGFLRQDG
jgi:RNA polymerase sigma factor (sigma-70 family)